MSTSFALVLEPPHYSNYRRTNQDIAKAHDVLINLHSQTYSISLLPNGTSGSQSHHSPMDGVAMPAVFPFPRSTIVNLTSSFSHLELHSSAKQQNDALMMRKCKRASHESGFGVVTGGHAPVLVTGHRSLWADRKTQL